MSSRVVPSEEPYMKKIFESSDSENMEDQIAIQTKEIIRMVSQVDEAMDSKNQRQAISLTMSQTMGQSAKVTDVVKKRRASVITRSTSVANTGDRLTLVKEGAAETKSKKVLEGMKGMTESVLIFRCESSSFP